MRLQTLKPKVKQTKKRVGRGNASGHGTYSTRGMKGQSARTGGRRRPGFEGGQTPFLRKMPKLKGFKNPNYTEFQVVNVADLNIFDDNATITAEDLRKKNLISKKTVGVKLLGTGELEKTVNITVEKASKSAIEKVEAKKGKVTLLAVDTKGDTKADKKADKKADTKSAKEEKAEKAPAETEEETSK